MSAGSTQQLVLVLNRLWQAINVCTAERALTLLYSGHAQVVCENDGNFNTFSFREWCDFSEQYAGDEVVKTIAFRIRIPRVILLLFFDRLPNKEVKFTRHNVFERDKNTCQYCGHKFDRKDLNIDHVVPRHRGGLTTWTNVVCSCVDCNRRKGSRSPAPHTNPARGALARASQVRSSSMSSPTMRPASGARCERYAPTPQPSTSTSPRARSPAAARISARRRSCPARQT